jgi:hypothetical protein
VEDTLAVDSLAADTQVADSLAADTLAAGSRVADTLAVGSLVEDTLAADILAADTLAVGSLVEDTLAVDSLAADTLAADTLAADTLAVDTLAADILAPVMVLVITQVLTLATADGLVAANIPALDGAAIGAGTSVDIRIGTVQISYGRYGYGLITPSPMATGNAQPSTKISMPIRISVPHPTKLRGMHFMIAEATIPKWKVATFPKAIAKEITNL